MLFDFGAAAGEGGGRVAADGRAEAVGVGKDAPPHVEVGRLVKVVQVDGVDAFCRAGEDCSTAVRGCRQFRRGGGRLR